MIYTGKIQDSNGRIITNATLEILDPAGQRITSLPVNKGNFTIDTNIDSGLFIDANTARFNAPGYSYYATEATQLLQNFTVTLVEQTTNAAAIVFGAGIAIIAMSSTKKKRSVGKLELNDVKTYGLIGVGILGFLILKQVLEMTGFWDSKDSKDLNNEQSDPSSPWSTTYWQHHDNNVSLDETTAKQWIDELQDAFGALNDDEPGAIGIFKRMRTKADLSYFSYIWDRVYGGDLLTWLRGGNWPLDRLSDADVNVINRYIQTLP